MLCVVVGALRNKNLSAAAASDGGGSGGGGSLQNSSPDLSASTRALRSRFQLEKVLQIFVPKEFQEIIAPNRSLDSVQLGDAELRCITILFSDIRDFTSITEKMYVHINANKCKHTHKATAIL